MGGLFSAFGDRTSLACASDLFRPSRSREFFLMLFPGSREFFDFRGMPGGEIFGFGTIRSQIVKLPGPVMVGYQFPVTDPNGAIAIMIPPEIVVSDRAVFREGGHETFAR